MRLCAVSVDLDGIEHYRAIHGLPPSEAGAFVVHERGLSRVLEWARVLGLPLTLFAIGRDLAHARCAEAVLSAARHGHRIENHSHGHRYDLIRGSREAMAAEVRAGADAIEALVGRRPTGFRAPGYLVSDELFEVLEDEGVRWDSSVFPCPWYFAAKWAVLAAMRLRGRGSGALRGEVAMVRAPRTPYRVARPWHRGAGGRAGTGRAPRSEGAPIIELPLAVTRRARLPVLGTSLTLAGSQLAPWLVGGCVDDPIISLGLHALDFLDRHDELQELPAYQVDLRLPVASKVRALAAAVGTLRAAGYSFVSVEDACAAMDAIGV